MADIVLSLVVLAALALVAGAYAYWKRTGETKQPILMLILAAVAVANILIWTVPTSSGDAPIDKAQEN